MVGFKSQKQAKFLQLYEDMGLGVEDIAEDAGVGVEVVKGFLGKHSEDYKEDIRNGQEVRGMLTGLYSNLEGLAYGSEDDKIRLEASKYLVEEATGRNQKRVEREVSGGEGRGSVLVIAQFNENMKKVRNALGGAEDVIEIAEVSEQG